MRQSEESITGIPELNREATPPSVSLTTSLVSLSTRSPFVLVKINSRTLIIMALENPDQYGAVDQTSRALMEKLDELLVDCTPKEIEDGHAYGVEYITGLKEMKQVSSH